MLSNKWTFSLTSFVVLIAFGLVCFVPSVMADGDAKKTHFDLTVKISAAESMIDVDHRGTDNDIQIATGRNRAGRAFAQVDALAITLLVEFSHVVNLALPGLTITDPLRDIDEETDNEPKPSHGDFGEDDLFVAAYDKEGRSLGVLNLDEAASVIGGTANIASISQFRDEGRPGRQFLIRIDESLLANAYVGRGGPVAGFEIYSLVFFIPKGLGGDPGATADASATRGIRKYDRAHAIAHFGPDAHQHLNAASNEFQVDLVDDDEGAAAYHIGVSETDAGPGVPGVATVHRIDDRVGFVESGPFDIRIILTEEAQGGFTKDSIDVANGSVTAFYVGTTLDGATTAEW